MKPQALDVEIAVPFSDVRELGGFAPAMQTIMGRLRDAADAQARAVNGELRATVAPEIEMKRTSSVLYGGDLLLVASRWVVDVPESFDPER